jgi:DNA polymerase-4
MPVRKIIHVDMDAFYSLVEQRDKLELRDRPVAVGRSAKRGVVAAASYEARAFGVCSALPSTMALRQCPELVFVPPRFDVYRAVSRQIHDIFVEDTSLIEPLALDEAYLDVTENRRQLPTASATAKEIRARILRDTGANMQRLGIQTGADLRAKSLGFLQQHFGKSAAWYLGIANAEDDRPVVADRQRKSSGSKTTFEHDLTAPDDIVAGVEAMAKDVWDWCEKAEAFSRTVTVMLKFAEFCQVTRSRSYPTMITRHDILRHASVELDRTLLPIAMGIRLLGVKVSNFDRALVDGVDALPLFGARETIPPRSEAASGVNEAGTR